MTTFTWLHVSDLHLRGTESDVHQDRFRYLRESIAATIRDERLTIDAVFFTGDLAFSGSPEQFEASKTWLDDLLAACGLDGRRDRLFIVPGNHDLDREAVRKPDWLHGQYVSFADEHLLSGDNPYGVVDCFLADNSHRKWALRKLENYWAFCREYHRGLSLPADSDHYFWVRSVEKDDCTIAVMGLNTAWLSFRDDEQGRLLMGETQVCAALKEVRDRFPKASVRVALAHHPLYWLAERDMQRVQWQLACNCDVLLHGHLHRTSLSVQSTPDSFLHVFAAGASLNRENDYHAYNIVRVENVGGPAKGTAFVRCQHGDTNPIWAPDSHTYRNARDGRIEFFLTRDGEMSLPENTGGGTP